MRALEFLAIGGLALSLPAGAAPNAQLQNLKWFVVDGIGDPGQDLAYFQGVIDGAMAEAQLLLQGAQGPADVPCCVDVRRVSAATELVAANLQAVDGEADYDAMTVHCQQAGGGSCAFLVRTLSYCGGPAPTSIGCADTPTCPENVAGDDPTLTLVVSLDALADGSLAHTLAHERGHNACLEHVPWAEHPADDACALMQPAAGGGCLVAAECGHYRDAGNAGGGACECHTDALATAADGAACSDGALGGVCSGGVCGLAGSDASVTLLAAGGPESIAGATSDQRIAVSGLSGAWSDLGSFANGAEVTGLEYAASRDAAYAVTSADQLLRVDPRSGATLATVATLPPTGSFDDFPSGATSNALYDSLAFDPGQSASPDDDVLLAVRVSESCRDFPPESCAEFCAGELVAIDPDTGSTALRGSLDALYCGGFPGLAFDVARRKLYVAAAAGLSLAEIDLACAPFFCVTTELMLGADETEQNALRQVLARVRPALAYGAATDRIYRLGSDQSRLVYDAFDAATFAFAEPIGLDDFTAGGLLAPEPGALGLGAGAFAALARLRPCARRSPRRRDRAARPDC